MKLIISIAVVLFLIMGRAVHQKQRTVPAANQEPAPLNVGYAASSSSKDVPGEGIRSLARAGSQIGYPDLTCMTEKAAEILLKPL